MTNTINPALTTLLGGGDDSQLIENLLGDRASNPLVKLLMTQMLARQETGDIIEGQAESVDPYEAEDGYYEEARPQRNLDKRRERFRRRIKHMSEELHALRRHSDELGRALGACCICWGYDEQCHDCAGQGRPGWALPEHTAFKNHIAPAVRRLQSDMSATRRVDTRVNQTRRTTHDDSE